MSDLLGGFAGLSIAIDSLRSSIERYSQENLRQKAISISTTLNDSIRENSGILSKLPGGLAGNLENALDATVVGMSGFDKNIGLLATQMKFSGQNQVGMLAALEQSRLIAGQSNAQMSNLSREILRSSVNYEIQTGVLVNAVKNLSERMAKYIGSGFTGPLQEAVTKLTAQVGPQNAERLTATIGSLLEPGIEGMVKASKLGLEGMRQSIFASQNSDQIVEYLKKTIIQGADFHSGLVANAKASSDYGTAIGIYGKIYDTTLTANTLVLRDSLKLKERELTQSEAATETLQKLRTSFETLTLTAISPLLTVMASLNDVLLRIGSVGNGIILKTAASITAIGALTFGIIKLITAINTSTILRKASIIQQMAIRGRLGSMMSIVGKLSKVITLIGRWAGIVGLIYTVVDLISTFVSGKGIFSVLGGLLFGDKEVDTMKVKKFETEKDAVDYVDLFGGTKTLLMDIFRDIVVDTNEVLIEETRLAREQAASYAERQLAEARKSNRRVITNN